MPRLKWYTVITRYEDEPQTCADWVRAITAKDASLCVDRDDAQMVAVLPGKVVVAWTPEEH